MMGQALPRLWAQDRRGEKGTSTAVAARPQLTRSASSSDTMKPKASGPASA